MRYYNVEQVETQGKRLLSQNYPPHFTGTLVAVCDRGVFKLAGDVSEKRNYDHLYSQYYQGLFLKFTLYECAGELERTT